MTVTAPASGVPVYGQDVGPAYPVALQFVKFIVPMDAPEPDNPPPPTVIAALIVIVIFTNVVAPALSVTVTVSVYTFAATAPVTRTIPC